MYNVINSKSKITNPKQIQNSNIQNSKQFWSFEFWSFGIVSNFEFRISNFFRQQSGFSLVEIILAIALFGLFATALLGLLMNSYGSSFQAKEKDMATLYAQQGLEAAWSIRRQAWNLLVNGDYGLDNALGYWQFSGSSDLLDDKYTRVITIADACRSGGNIVDCPIGTIDPHLKKITVTVTYTAITQINNTVELDSYLTIWQSKDWVQTDWSGGAGQSQWSDITEYFSDDGNIDYSTGGEVKLASLGGGGCGTKIWPFAAAGNYTLSDPGKIEVSASFAQLISSGGVPVSGQTLNPDFTSNLNNWSHAKWGTYRTVSRKRMASGGNPGAYLEHRTPRTRNTFAGGYDEQAFTVVGGSITATASFDWSVTRFDAPPDSFQAYVFVDDFSGEPVIGQEVWSSGELTDLTSWNSVIDLDVSGKISGPGIYYLKIAIWVDYSGTRARYRLGWDNVALSWQGIDTPTYPIDRPTVNPTASYSVPTIDAWSSFAETAIKNNGEIYYQLSDDDGTTWYYWNGSSWAVAGAGQYNTATMVSANISSFSTASARIMFKAFLESDGSQPVQLDEVKISCAQYYDWPFDDPSPAVYTYNDSEIEVISGTAQLKGGGGSCIDDPGATPCGNFTDGIPCSTQDGCSWIPGSGSCQPQPGGSCPGVSVSQCDTCSDAGCVKFRGDCTGNLDCSFYADELFCNTACNQCYWVGSSGSCIDDPGATACSFPDEPTCNIQDGCSWTPGSYPTSSDIYPVNSYNAPDVWEYTIFSEIATKNGGEIYYQLSDNDGVTWYYWNGSIWAAAGAGQYNTADIVNTNILLFPTTTPEIKFKAFLTGDGSQQVSLDNVRIGWGEFASSGYATSGTLESSAYDTGEQSAFNFLSWTETLPSALEDIQVQLATAPDSGGSPGVWSAWLGLAGAGSFYTDGAEILIPLSNGHNDDQWIKYQIILSGDGSDTPVLEEIKVNYLP